MSRWDDADAVLDMGLLWTELSGSDFVRGQLALAQRATGAETASLMLLDQSGSHLVFCASQGLNAERYTGQGRPEAAQRVPLSGGQGINPLVVLLGKPISMTNAEDPRHNPVVDGAIGTRTMSLVALPLVVMGRVVGTVSAINAHFLDGGAQPFSESDQELLGCACEAIRLHVNAGLQERTGEAQDLRDRQ